MTVFALFVTPALADVVTVCDMPSQFPTSASQAAPFAKLSRALAGSHDSFGPAMAPQIALARDERGFDVVLNWRNDGEKSLRAAGADIYGMETGPNFVHLMVAREAANLEHFLFSLDDDGAGELLWSDETDAHAARSVCARPR